MELGLVSMRNVPSFRNQTELISKCARAHGYGITELTLGEVVVGPPRWRWDKFIAVMPLWRRYLFDILRLTAWISKDHVIYGPVDGPYRMNLNLFAIMKNLNLATPSQWCADCIRESAGVPAKVIPHGIDHADFKFSDAQIRTQRKAWLGDKTDRVVLFSNLTPLHRKGFPHLCKAVGRLYERMGKKFLLVLHTGLKKAKEFYPKLGSTPGMIVEDAYGKLPFRAVALKTRAADVYVSPSLLEGCGLPILEAMAAKRVIVCLDAPAMNELVGPNEAWLFPCSHVKTEKWGCGAIAQLHEYNPQVLTDAMEAAITETAESQEKAEAAYVKSQDYAFMKVYPHLLKA